jgi:hypothetical protein
MRVAADERAIDNNFITAAAAYDRASDAGLKIFHTADEHASTTMLCQRICLQRRYHL